MSAARRPDVVVVGGGIVGVCVASALVAEGCAVRLIERGPFGGAVTGASLACLGTHMHDLAELPLLIEATRLWADLAARLPDMEYRRCGQLRFILDEADVAVAERWIAGERAAGLSPSLLDPTAVRDVEPLLTGAIVGASWSPDDATVNPFLAVRRILSEAVRGGLDARPHTTVTQLLESGGRIRGVATSDGPVEADRVVIAAGPWATRLLAGAGVTIPIAPRQAQCLASLRQPPRIRRVVGACESAGGVEVGYTQIQQAASGQILFNTVVAGGLTEPGAEDERRQAPAGFVVDSIRMLVRLFPSLAGLDLLRSWARFEAVTPDGHFLVGPAGPDGLVIAAGDNGSGYCRAPLLGRIVADHLLRGTPVPSLYRAGRFTEAGA
jgi:sarcosine oxidase subunit beta